MHIFSVIWVNFIYVILQLRGIIYGSVQKMQLLKIYINVRYILKAYKLESLTLNNSVKAEDRYVKYLIFTTMNMLNIKYFEF